MKLLLIEAHFFGYRGLQSLINIFDESSFSLYERAAAAAELRDINKQNTEKLLSVSKAAPHGCLRHLRGSSTAAFSLVCADRHQHLNIIIIAHRLELLDSILFSSARFSKETRVRSNEVGMSQALKIAWAMCH